MLSVSRRVFSVITRKKIRDHDLAIADGRSGAPLPRRLLRLGVRYADGRKATTIAQQPRGMPAPGDPPAGPLLSCRPGNSGMHGRDQGFSGFGLWLWPLPPAEPFEFAAEWPFGGIELGIIELDGAAITAAASRSAFYWPEPEPEPAPEPALEAAPGAGQA